MYTSKRVIRPNNEVVRYYCDNGYGLSVACHEHSYGGKEGLYEIALLKGDKLHYDDEWTDVKGWLTTRERPAIRGHHNVTGLPLKVQFHKDLLSLRKNAHDRQPIDHTHCRNNTLLLRRLV